MFNIGAFLGVICSPFLLALIFLGIFYIDDKISSKQEKKDD